MNKWEYCLLHFEHSGDSKVNQLNDKGKEGWELTSVIRDSIGQDIAYLKRPLIESKQEIQIGKPERKKVVDCEGPGKYQCSCKGEYCGDE